MVVRPEGYRSRLVDGMVEESLRSFGGVVIEGPRGCGKTWTGLAHSDGHSIPKDADICWPRAMDMQTVSSGPHPIDACQDVAGTEAIAGSERDTPLENGGPISTSSSVQTSRSLIEKSNGRMMGIRMRPMSLYESGDSDGSVSLRTIMSGGSMEFVQNPVSLERLVDLIIGGGWPGCIGLSSEDRVGFVRSYLECSVHDASVFGGMRRKESNVRSVLKALARSESIPSPVTKVCRDTCVPFERYGPLILPGRTIGSESAVSYDTAIDYLCVFRDMFLTDDQPAFDPEMRSSIKVGKTAKRHLADPSLTAAALGAGKDRLMNDLVTTEYLLEALCERDLRIYAETMGAGLFHYRDDSGREVDAIVELPDGRWGAFEIKLGANQIEDAAKNLLDFRKSLEKHGASRIPDVLCVICGLTEYSYLRNDGVYVVAVTVLGP